MMSYHCAQMLCGKKLVHQPRPQQCLVHQGYVIARTRELRIQRTEGVFQLTSTDVTNQSCTLLVYSTGENGKPSIVVSRYQQILQLISQSLYGIFAVYAYDIDVAVGLSR